MYNKKSKTSRLGFRPISVIDFNYRAKASAMTPARARLTGATSEEPALGPTTSVAVETGPSEPGVGVKATVSVGVGR